MSVARVSREAQKDLDSIWDYIAEHDVDAPARH
jgi:plasmid stabilization system protein ParE